MASDRNSFEVQVMRNGRWNTETICRKEDEATAVAKTLLKDKTCEGAQVIRSWQHADGTCSDTVCFSETRTIRDDAPARISQIDDAPPSCEKPEDYFGPQSKMIVNRLLRTYLEKESVTATEVMYSHRVLKRLQDKDNLLPSAVDRVAFLQTREGEKDHKLRRDEIFKNIEGMAARARRAETIKLPSLADGFKALLDKLGAQAGNGDTPDYLAMVALARELSNLNNWAGKLDHLCKLALGDDDAKALGMLDGAIADVLGSNVMQDLLGAQSNLGNAIVTMLNLADGKMNVAKSDVADTAEALNRLFQMNRLPLARAVVVDRAIRQLKSPNPLCRTDPSKEIDTLEMVAKRLLTPLAWAYGPDAAEGLTTRQLAMGMGGGTSGRHSAVLLCFNTLPDAAFGIMYLANLAGSGFAKDNLPAIIDVAGRILTITRLVDLCPGKLSTKDRMTRATNAHRALIASPLPDEAKRKLAGHIDLLVEKYLVDEQIIEKLDDPTSSLRDRAVRLVQFCAAGVLPQGRAILLARTRIQTLLRQPNFDAHFIEGIIDSAKAATALADFHKLLVRGGFK